MEARVAVKVDGGGGSTLGGPLWLLEELHTVLFYQEPYRHVRRKQEEERRHD